MDELEHEVDETKSERGVAVSEEGAATPHDESPKTTGGPARPGNRRLFAALLTCAVVALVALGVWGVQTAGGSAALTTVTQEEAKAEGGKTGSAQASSGGQSKQQASGKEAAEKPAQQTSGQGAAEKPAQQPAPVSQEASQPAPAPEPAAASSANGVSLASDAAVTTTVVEVPEPEPAAAPAPEPVPESPAAVTTEPAPAPEPAPVPEPTAMTIRVSVDGTPAGGGYRDATVTLAPGASVYDALLATGAGVNARGSVYGTYVAAIDGLAEKDHGGMSGWVYAVNGVEPQTACSNYSLSDGDVVAWLYVNAEY